MRDAALVLPNHPASVTGQRDGLRDARGDVDDRVVGRRVNDHGDGDGKRFRYRWVGIVVYGIDGGDHLPCVRLQKLPVFDSAWSSTGLVSKTVVEFCVGAGSKQELAGLRRQSQ